MIRDTEKRLKLGHFRGYRYKKKWFKPVFALDLRGMPTKIDRKTCTFSGQ